MPQNDRHRNRKIPLEFKFYSNLDQIVRKKRLSITLISSGSVKIRINDRPYQIDAPALMCCQPDDKVVFIKRKDLIAQTFYFDPWYIKACLHFKNLDPAISVDAAYEHHKFMLYNIFINRTSTYQGIFNLSPSSYLQLHDHLALIGSETYTQSDRYWTCRIRRLLVASLNCINDLYVDQRKMGFYTNDNSFSIRHCMDYIHEHYQEKLTLEGLCKVMSTNRSTLNETFKEVVGCTAMKYLNDYRIHIASELLSHTTMTIEDVSEAYGFASPSYFLRQYKQKTAKTPKEFRAFLSGLE